MKKSFVLMLCVAMLTTLLPGCADASAVSSTPAPPEATSSLSAPASTPAPLPVPIEPQPLVSSFTPAIPTTFSDVPATHWAYDSIENVYKKGLMVGIGEGKFDPEGKLTDAQVAQIVLNAYGGNGLAPDLPAIKDVQSDAWYYEAVTWLVQNELAQLDSDGNFGPNDPSQRWFVDHVLVGVAQRAAVTLPTTNEAVVFPDVIGEYAAHSDDITALQRAGVLSGYPDGTYGPGKTLTRAEMAKIIDLFTDIPGLEAGTKLPLPEPPPVAPPPVTPPPTTPVTPEPPVTPQPPDPPEPATPPTNNFLSKDICAEVREYALSLGFERVTDYTDSAGGWIINIRNATTGRCDRLGLRLGAGTDHWAYVVSTDDSYGASVEDGRVSSMEEMKALILRCSNY